MSSDQKDVPPSAGETPLSDGPTTIPGAVPPLADIPPLGRAEIHQAELRRENLRTDTMITLAIGFVAHSLGRQCFVLAPALLEKFAREYTVAVEDELGDGVVSYTVVKKEGGES